MLPLPIARKLGVCAEHMLVRLRADKATLQHWDAAGAPTPTTTDLHQQDSDITTALPAGKPVFVDIGIENALTGQLTMPFAAERRLGQAVAFEVERLSPFQVADALFDYTVIERDKGTKTLTVEWAVVPRTLVDKSYDAVAKLGLRPFAIGLAGDRPRDPRYTFARYRDVRPWRIERPAAALIAACLFLALAAGYTVHASQAGTRQVLTQIDAAKGKAERAKTLRAQTEAMAAAEARLADPSHVPSPAAILAELSSRLPQDTWVHRLSLNGAELRLIGVSAAASPLIERLAASPLLRNPRFSAPITAASVDQGKTRLENFDIAATIQTPKVPGGKQ